MANGTLTDEETDDTQNDAQPIAAPSVTPPTATPPPATTTPAAAPAFIRAPGYDPQAVRLEMQRSQMLNAGIPFDQAEKAVSAALKFQAQRGYQKDIAGGMSAVDAMVKWGSTMFGSTAGSASALARVATAAQPNAPRTMVVNNRVVRAGATGAAEDITPWKMPPEKLNPQLATQYAKALTANEAQIAAAQDPWSDDIMRLRYRNIDLMRKLRGPTQPQGQPVSPPAGVAAPSGAATPVTAPTAPPVAASTVIRRTKDGRRAVFDASTRKFIRYAD